MKEQTEPHLEIPSHYVGIGASAGGLEAIEYFFNNMPSDSGVALIIIQHLSPDHKSLMAELLSKKTSMNVQQAEDGMSVFANNVYLIPPNMNMRIFHGKLLLNEQHRQGEINLPIDIFFSSLAHDQADKAIAIILSGTGSDGSRGIKAIKENVGMVMVQSEETAAFDGMPRAAAATGIVDYILPPEDMPQQLISYVKHSYANKNEGIKAILTDQDGIGNILVLLREKTGIDFTYYKSSTVVRRIQRRMTVNQIYELRDYVHYIRNYPKEIDYLHRDLLIGVTSFFRNKEAFKILEKEYLPDLLAKKSGTDIRFWVTACSTGEEAFSLAILCSEIMEKKKINVNLKIFATDVDQNAISYSGFGLYPDSIAADVSADLLAKYFYRKDNGYQISRHIRKLVVFAQHNVAKDPPFTNIELISCRNLLIYMQSVLQKRVMELFNFSLNEGGILFLGTSETTGDASSYFDVLDNKWKLYRSKGVERRQALGNAGRSLRDNYLKKSSVTTQAPIVPVNSVKDKVLERLVQSLSNEYLPFIMVVNENMDIIHVIGDSKNYLVFPSGRMQSNVTKLIHKSLSIPLSTGIQKLLKHQQDIHYTNITLKESEDYAKVDMRLKMLDGLKGQEVLIAICIEEHSKMQIVDNSDSPLPYDIGKESEQRILDLEQELQFTRENLQATVEELETSNEELQATNEELLASNEELQSTNEELQSVNEELYTVNAEYQGKIIELTEVNNDLDNLLTNIKIGTIFLDENMEVRRYTGKVTSFIKIMDNDIGRPFDHIAHSLVDVDFSDLIHQVKHSNKVLEKEVSDKNDNIYLLTILPYRVGPHVYSGVLLTFVDITRINQVKTTLEQTKDHYMLAQTAANIASWDWDVQNNQASWSANISNILGYKPDNYNSSLEAFIASCHADDLEQLEQIFSRTLKDTDSDLHIEYRTVWPDNSIHWLSLTGKTYFQQDKPIRILGVLQEITIRKLAEQGLINSEKRLRNLFSSVPVAIFVLVDNTFDWTNRQLQQMTGYNEKELSTNANKILFVDDLHQSTDEIISELLKDNGKENISYETKWSKKDGTIIDVIISCSMVEAGNLQAGLICTVTDTTQQLYLSSQYHFLQTIMQNTSDIIYAIDGKGSICNWSYSAEKVYGYSDSEAIGLNIKELIPESEQENFFNTLFHSAQEPDLENKLTDQRISQLGKTFSVKMSVIETNNSENKLSSYVILEQQSN